MTFGLSCNFLAAGMMITTQGCQVSGDWVPVQLPVPPALLEISSINRLLDIASRIVSRHDAPLPQTKAAAMWRQWLAARIAAETPEAAEARWRDWQGVLRTFGTSNEQLAVALSSRSKAFMIFMHMAMRHGSGRVSFKVILSPSPSLAEYFFPNHVYLMETAMVSPPYPRALWLLYTRRKVSFMSAINLKCYYCVWLVSMAISHCWHVTLQVRRDNPFTDSMRQARHMQLLEQTLGGMVVYPTFSERSSSGSTSPDLDSNVEDNDVRPSARQEFFERVGEEVTRGEGITVSFLFKLFCPRAGAVELLNEPVIRSCLTLMSYSH